MEYRLNKGDLTLPDDWVDETIYIFKAPEHEGYNIVVNQAMVSHGVDADSFLDEQYLLLKENLTDYQESDRRRSSERPLQLLEYQWRSPEGLAYQINKMIVVDNTLLSFTATATQKFSDEQKEVIMNILKSYDYSGE